MAVLEEPVHSLSPRTFNQLACALEPHSPRGNDWEGVADFVGFPTAEIRAIQAQGGCTIRVFTVWDNSGKSSVRNLIIALICLERVDCVRVLKEEPALRGVDFAELHKTAAQMKENDETFPRFESGELDIFQRPQLYCPPPQESPWERTSYQQSAPFERNSYQQSASTAASSPNEEWPPSSQTQSEATGFSPSKNAVFISYYPEPYTLNQVQSLSAQLVANGFHVYYANEQQMTDAEWKSMAILTSYNIIVMCTPRYYDEDQRLLSLSQCPSAAAFEKPPKTAIDRKIIRELFFTPGEDKRILCVYLDRDRENYSRCIPFTFRSRPCLRFPSQLVDVMRFVSDMPKCRAPAPVPRISVEPEKINYPDALERFLASRGKQVDKSPVRMTACSPQRNITPRQNASQRNARAQHNARSQCNVRTQKTPLSKMNIFKRLLK